VNIGEDYETGRSVRRSVCPSVCRRCVCAIALYRNLSQSYGASPAIWDHSVTCYPTQVNAPRLNPSQIYLPRRDRRL